MTVMETYVPGTFCWAELGTPDSAVVYVKRYLWIGSKVIKCTGIDENEHVDIIADFQKFLDSQVCIADHG